MLSDSRQPQFERLVRPGGAERLDYKHLTAFGVHRNSLVVTFAAVNGLLLVAPGLDLHEALLLAGVDDGSDLLLETLKVLVLVNLEVLLHFAILGHEHEVTILVDVNAGVLGLLDNGAGDHVTSAVGFFVLLVGENVLAGDHGLGGTVLAGLGGRESSNLAGEFALHHEQGAGLSAAGFVELDVGGTGVTLDELIFFVGVVNDDGAGIGGSGEGAAVTVLGLAVGDDGTLGHLVDGQNVANVQGSLLDGVEVLTDLHALDGHEEVSEATLAGGAHLPAS